MELYYKVLRIEKTPDSPVITYQKECKSSEPLFARRAAIAEAEKLRDTIEAAKEKNPQSNNEAVTIIVTLCFSAVPGLVSELPIHFIYGNEDLNLLTHHSWPFETSLYYQYQYDTGGDIANYMGVLVLPDVMEQVIEDQF
jgi:hypothetical protein